jgi:hypothetical protein
MDEDHTTFLPCTRRRGLKVSIPTMKTLCMAGTTHSISVESLCRHRLPSPQHPNIDGAFDPSLLAARCSRCSSDGLTACKPGPAPQSVKVSVMIAPKMAAKEAEGHLPGCWSIAHGLLAARSWMLPVSSIHSVQLFVDLLTTNFFSTTTTSYPFYRYSSCA